MNENMNMDPYDSNNAFACGITDTRNQKPKTDKIDRQTDRQADRQIDRKTDRQTDRQTDR